MIEGFLSLLFLAGFLYLGGRGAFQMAVGGYLSLGLGALVASAICSMLLAGLASLALQMIMLNDAEQLNNIQATAPKTTPSTLAQISSAASTFLKGALAAMAQPTTTSVALFATLIVLSYAAVRVRELALKARFLYDSHTALLNGTMNNRSAPTK